MEGIPRLHGSSLDRFETRYDRGSDVLMDCAIVCRDMVKMKRVLVVRNDKMGDFMLAWPALALLAESGQCEVSVLVPEYTADLARMCPWISHVVIDPGRNAPFDRQQAMVDDIQALKLDATIALFSDWRNAVTLRHAKIPYRLAPATKLAQFLYTHKLVQRRSRSLKPEWEYNLDLAARFLQDHNLPVRSVQPPYMRVPFDERSAARRQIADALGFSVQDKWLVVHVGSGGSAVNLSLSQYETLISELSQQLPGWQVLLSAGPDEQALVGGLHAALVARHVPASMLASHQGLRGLVLAISNADCFIAGSTGPLHVAGALDVPTVGFFPARRSGTALRWQPLNSQGRHLALQADQDKGERSFDNIDLQTVKRNILNWLESIPAPIGSCDSPRSKR